MPDKKEMQIKLLKMHLAFLTDPEHGELHEEMWESLKKDIDWMDTRDWSVEK